MTLTIAENCTNCSVLLWTTANYNTTGSQKTPWIACSNLHIMGTPNDGTRRVLINEFAASLKHYGFTRPARSLFHGSFLPRLQSGTTGINRIVTGVLDRYLLANMEKGLECELSMLVQVQRQRTKSVFRNSAHILWSMFTRRLNVWLHKNPNTLVFRPLFVFICPQQPFNVFLRSFRRTCLAKEHIRQFQKTKL